MASIPTPEDECAQQLLKQLQVTLPPEHISLSVPSPSRPSLLIRSSAGCWSRSLMDRRRLPQVMRPCASGL